MNKKILLLLTLSCAIIIGVLFFLRKLHLKKVEQKTNAIRPNHAALDSLQMMIQHADIVLRRGADATSELFVKMNRHSQVYSHCGIYLHDSSGKSFVYHSIGGENNPSNKIAKCTLEEFWNANQNSAAGICRIACTTKEKSRIDSIAKKWYHLAYTFDMDFDLHNSDSLLYCAEYVAKVVEKAKQQQVFEHSYIASKNFEYIAIDNITSGKNCKIIYATNLREK